MRALTIAVLALLAALVATPLTPASAGAQTSRHKCEWCHSLHGASASNLTNYVTSQALCESCHGPTGPAFVDRDGIQVAVPKNVVIHNGLKHSAPTSCWNCHDHEGEAGTNLSMIPLNRTGAAGGVTRAVVFTSRSGAKSFADGDATYDGVCEVCHTTTNEHRFDGSVSKHNAAANCTTCHKHDVGFKGGGRCTGCHNQQQNGRRPILNDFGRVSHHVDWLAAGLLAADSIPDSDCQKCHDQSQHQQGSVRLWNVDQPGNTAAAIVLTGDPNTVTAEAAKLEAFCATCHDTNGANGDITPFSDGVTRPLISTTAWATASHATSASVPAGCYGNGTTGCHASGHGSEKRQMLAPYTTAAVSPALAEEQEGFCFTCHDGSPATSNIASLFAIAINWVQEATGLSANPNLNDRHDVQHAAQTRSAAKIECVNCHNPHEATNAQPYILDPDPNDGHVVGTNWYFTAYQTANDRLSEFCLDCHDGSFPSGVLGHSPTPITNIRTTWVNDGMGQRTSSNVNLRAGTGWGIGDVMPCSACHVSTHIEPDANVSNTPNLFAVVDTLKNKAGTSALFFNGGGRNDPNIYRYAITNNLATADSTSGGWWCNSCHDRTSMTGKSNCYACHRHGDGGRF